MCNRNHLYRLLSKTTQIKEIYLWNLLHQCMDGSTHCIRQEQGYNASHHIFSFPFPNHVDPSVKIVLFTLYSSENLESKGESDKILKIELI